MDEHSVHADVLARRRRGDYEISLTVCGVAEEHASYVAKQLEALTRLFKLDGSSVDTVLSARRQGDRHEVERIFELL